MGDDDPDLIVIVAAPAAAAETVTQVISRQKWQRIQPKFFVISFAYSVLFAKQVSSLDPLPMIFVGM